MRRVKGLRMGKQRIKDRKITEKDGMWRKGEWPWGYLALVLRLSLSSSWKLSDNMPHWAMLHFITLCYATHSMCNNFSLTCYVQYTMLHHLNTKWQSFPLWTSVSLKHFKVKLILQFKCHLSATKVSCFFLSWNSCVKVEILPLLTCSLLFFVLFLFLSATTCGFHVSVLSLCLDGRPWEHPSSFIAP